MGKKNESKPDETLEDKPDESSDESEQEPETFDKAYVQGLRDENAKYRTRANDYGKRLHAELVKADGRLASHEDLEFSEDHLENPEKLTAAIESLVNAKPHLKTRKVTGDVSQGKRGDAPESTDFMGFVRSLI